MTLGQQGNERLLASIDAAASGGDTYHFPLPSDHDVLVTADNAESLRAYVAELPTREEVAAAALAMKAAVEARFGPYEPAE